MAPLGFAGLFWVLRGRTARAGFGYGFVAGVGLMIPLLWWTGEFVGPIASIPLAMVQAVLVGAGIAVVTTLRAAPLWAALLWVAGETLRALVPFGGFPWGKIAFSQPDGVYLPLVAVGGTPLVAFAVSLTGFGLAELVRRSVVGRDRRPVRVAVLAVAVVAPIVAGLSAMPLVSAAPEVGEVTVAVVQGNVPRAGLDFNAQRRAVLDNHVRRTANSARTSAPGGCRDPSW